MTQVVRDREQGANGVHPQSEPPDELFVKLLLEVLQHQQTNRQASQRTGNVRDVADWRRGRWFKRVPAVYRETNINAGCNTNVHESVINL